MNFNHSESQFATLAERLPQLVWSTRPDGFHDYFNRQWYDFTGLSPEQSVGSGWRSAVHTDDLKTVDWLWAVALAAGEPYEVEYRIRSASGAFSWVLSRGMPDRNEAGTVLRWFGTCTIIDAQKQAEASLRGLEEQHRLALDAARLGTWRVERETGTVSWDEGCCALFDIPADGLRSLPIDEAFERVHPDDRDAVRARMEAALAPGSNGVYEVEYRTVLQDGSVRWTRSNGRVIYVDDCPERRVAGLSGVIGDVTHRRSVAEAQELLMRELSHRVKNLFAIANGMVSMTARTAKDTKEMATALRGRLSALARAHELAQPLTVGAPSTGARASLSQLIDAVLAPYVEAGGSQVIAAGPPVSVGSNTTTSLALVLHELATNAAKYGCLSRPEGHLTIRWTETETGVDLIWEETGGPPLEGAPTFEGFGTQLALRSVSGQLGGSLERDWRPDGLHLHMILPFDRLSL
ncbi:sensor histidine kinase [Microvirga antarctica]|uniref:sensor histidine kinase n=1 Tax=Microvirga antarctica TaxID=2819233 RepID=UPI001B3056E4